MRPLVISARKSAEVWNENGTKGGYGIGQPATCPRLAQVATSLLLLCALLLAGCGPEPRNTLAPEGITTGPCQETGQGAGTAPQPTSATALLHGEELHIVMAVDSVGFCRTWTISLGADTGPAGGWTGGPACAFPSGADWVLTWHRGQWWFGTMPVSVGPIRVPVDVWFTAGMLRLAASATPYGVPLQAGNPYLLTVEQIAMTDPPRLEWRKPAWRFAGSLAWEQP